MSLNGQKSKVTIITSKNPRIDEILKFFSITRNYNRKIG